MSTDAAITALIRHNRARSETKKDAVRAAIARLTEAPRHTINKSLVARHAGVSREFINSHPDLKELINTVAATHAKNGIATAPTRTVDAVTSGLRAQNRTFADTIAHQKSTIADLRATIEELRHQRKLHLGAQLAAKIVDPDVHNRLQIDHDRLAADKRRLEARIDELERVANDLREDLAASRQAHAADIAQHPSRHDAPVVPLKQDRSSRLR